MVIVAMKSRYHNSKDIIERAETMDYYQKLEDLLSQMALESYVRIMV